MIGRIAGLAATVLLAGCVHVDSTKNAPGHADLTRRPELAAHAIEPRDPGERMIVVAAGPTVGGGAVLDGAGAHAFSAFGGELSVFGAFSKTRHIGGGLAIVTPETAFGLTFGGTTLGSSPRGGVPLYGEAAVRIHSVTGLGVGWQVDPRDGTSGPQVTISTGPIYIRFAHQLGSATYLSLGLVLKGQLAFVFNR